MPSGRLFLPSQGWIENRLSAIVPTAHLQNPVFVKRKNNITFVSKTIQIDMQNKLTEELLKYVLPLEVTAYFDLVNMSAKEDRLHLYLDAAP